MANEQQPARPRQVSSRAEQEAAMGGQPPPRTEQAQQTAAMAARSGPGGKRVSLRAVNEGMMAVFDAVDQAADQGEDTATLLEYCDSMLHQLRTRHGQQGGAR